MPVAGLTRGEGAGSASVKGSEHVETTERPVAGQMYSRPLLRLMHLPVLLLCDCAALVVSISVAYLSWALPVRGQPPEVYLQVWPLLTLFPLAYFALGLYPGFGLGGVEILRRTTLGTAFVFFALAALSFVVKLPPTFSRMTFALAILFAWILVPLGRYLLLRLTQGWNWWPEPVLVFGTSAKAARTIRSLNSALSLGYRPVGVLESAGAPPGRIEEVEGCPVLGDLSAAPTLADRGIRVILVVDDGKEFDLGSHLDELQGMFRHVIWIRSGEGTPVEGLELRNLGSVVGVEFLNQLLVPHNRVLKRATDLAIGIPAAVVGSLFVLPAALVVKVVSPGPAFYRQERAGLNGRSIQVWKIRTMHVDAQERLDELLATSPAAREQWEDGYKLANDPRIIRGIGRFLRRFSLDELPQLWQVVSGTMSLVGPRPFPSYHLEGYSPSILTLRQRVRPGVTGLWQVKVRSRGGLGEQQSHDAYYIRNWSLWMDLYVLGQTVSAVLSGRGAS